MKWRNLRGAARVAVLSAFCGVLACSDGTGPGDAGGTGGIGTPAAGPPTLASAASGGGQSAVVGAKLATPLVVRIVDASGRAVSGATVSWSVSAEGGSLSATSSTSDPQGEAKTEWTLGSRAGAHTVTATVGSLPAVTFTATATAGAAAKVAKTSGDAQSGTVGAALANPLVVRVLDAQNNPVAGVPVAWAVTGGGGSLTALAATSDSTGEARATWTLGTVAGANSATATVGDGIVGFTATATAGSASSVVISASPDTLIANGTAQLTASARDQYGNLVSGTVTWRSSSAAVTVNGNGLVTAALVGAAQVTATVQGASASRTFVVVQPTPATGIRIRVSSPVEATRYFLAIDGGGFDTPEVVQVLTAPTKSAVLSLSVPAGGPYRVRVMVREGQNLDPSATVAATGKATSVVVASGAATHVDVALERPSYSISVPATAAGGTTVTVTWTITDPGSSIDNVGFPWQGRVEYTGSASGTSAVVASQLSPTTYSFSASFKAPIQPGTVQVRASALSFANIYTMGVDAHTVHWTPSAARGEAAATITIQ